MAEKTYTYIPAELKSAQVDGIVVSTEGVYDYLLNKNLLEINQDQKELNKNTLLWDSESNSFVRYDENGNIINMGDKLTEVVVNNIADEEKEYGHIVAETVVNLIVNNEELGDEITNTVVTNILNEEKNFGNELTENIINNLLEGDEITNYLETNNYITENDLSNYATKSDLNNSVAGAGKVNDVIINDTSIVSNKNANIAVEGTYNSSSNPIASMNAVKNIPNDADFITNLKNNLTFTTYIRNQASDAAGGGEENVIETVKVNNTALTVTNKAVNVTVPTQISDLSDGTALKTTVNNLDTTVSSLNDAIEDINDALEGGGIGEMNKINTVKVNGSALTPDAAKAVDVTVPTKVSDLTNDSGFVTNSSVSTTINNILNDSNNPIANIKVTNLTTNKIVKNIQTPTISNNNIVTINAGDGDLLIKTITSNVDGITITNATVGLNITVILENNGAADYTVSIKNGTASGNTYKWNGGSAVGETISLISPVGGYCEVSFLCGAANKFYVRGV